MTRKLTYLNVALGLTALILLTKLASKEYSSASARRLLSRGVVSYEGPTLLSYSQVSDPTLPWLNREEKIAIRELVGLLPHDQLTTDPFGKGYTCAVVGNSSKLLGSKLGEKIDSYEKVLRINEAPTNGFQADVGSRTEIRLLNAHRMPPSDENEAGVTLILSYHGEGHIERFSNLARNGRFRGYHSVYPLSPQLSAWASEVGNMVPSSGILATLLAATRCDKVGVFGVGPGHDGLWSHYFPKETPSPPHHSHESERVFFEALQAGRLIEMF